MRLYFKRSEEPSVNRIRFVFYCFPLSGYLEGEQMLAREAVTRSFTYLTIREHQNLPYSGFEPQKVYVSRTCEKRR